MIKSTILLFCFGICLVRSFPGETVETAEVVSIVSQHSELKPDGQYDFGFESADGTVQQQKATLVTDNEKPVLKVQGKYTYTGPEGNVNSLSYTADEKGFQPEGDVLPVAPPIPVPIARALKWIEEHPYHEKEHKE